MQAEKLKITDFTEILNIIDTTSSLYVIPYSWVTDSETGETKCFVFTMQEVTGFIRPFRASSKKDEEVSKTVANALRESTFGLINIKESKRNSVMKVHLYADVDEEGAPTISGEKIPIVTVNLKLRTKEELNHLVESYVSLLKTKILMEPTSRGLMTNLVYMTNSDLYYLARGTTYTVTDEDEEYEYQVSNGIFFEKDIVDLYTPNRAAGEIPLTILPTPEANSPFQSILFSKISSEFAVMVYDIMSLDVEDDEVIFY